MPKCLWWGYFLMSVTESNRGMRAAFCFLEKITSFPCLLGLGLNYIFHWKAHLLVFPKSEFDSFADISIS